MYEIGRVRGPVAPTDDDDDDINLLQLDSRPVTAVSSLVHK